MEKAHEADRCIGILRCILNYDHHDQQDCTDDVQVSALSAYVLFSTHLVARISVVMIGSGTELEMVMEYHQGIHLLYNALAFL